MWLLHAGCYAHAGDGFREAQIGRHLKRALRIRRRHARFKRVVRHPEKVRRRVPDAVSQLAFVRDTDVRRQTGRSGSECSCHDRAHRRLVISILRRRVRAGIVVAGEDPVDRRLVARRRVVDASQHVEVVNPLSKKRQMLAALVPRNAGGDLRELAANLSRGIRLGIKCLMLRRTAGQIQKNYILKDKYLDHEQTVCQKLLNHFFWAF